MRRAALVNSHFAVPKVHMLQLRDGGAGFIDPSQRIFYRRGQPVDLARFAPARRAEFLWYVGDQPPVRLPAGARVIFRSESAFLARLANSPAQR